LTNALNGNLDFIALPVVLNSIPAAKSLDCNRESKIAFVGNVDGSSDGYQEFVITYPNGTANESKALLFFGERILSTIQDTALALQLRDYGPNNDLFGYSVAGVGDVNHDGKDDILIGKQTINGTGRALLFMGRNRGDFPSPYRYNPANPDESHGVLAINDPVPELFANVNTTANNKTQFGLTVAGIGDIDHDGYADFMIGAPYYGDSDIGAVYVYLGGAFADTVVGQDNLRKYVLTGKTEWAHYGMQITNVGDFDANGYSNVAISAPGFRGTPAFAGYSAVQGIAAVNNHYVDVFTNTTGTDKERPILLLNQIYPRDGVSGLDPTSTINFILADRGNAGLEFNTLQINLFRKGISTGTEVIRTKRTTDPNNPNFVPPDPYKDFTLVSFWAATGNINQKRTFNKLGDWANSEFATLTGAKVNGFNIYRYRANPKFIGISLKPTQNSELLSKIDDYYYQIKITDRTNDPQSEFAGPEAERVVTLNFSTIQERYLTSNASVGSQIVPIGDFDGDGLDDFAVTDPGNNRVKIYWGNHAVNFNAAPDIIIAPDPYVNVKNFGISITHLNIDNDECGDVAIGYQSNVGSDHGFFVIRGAITKPTASYFRNKTKYTFGETGSYGEYITRIPLLINGMPKIIGVHNMSGRLETLAVTWTKDNDSLTQQMLHCRFSGVVVSSNVIELANTPVIETMATGYLSGTDTQQLLLGIPSYDSSNGGGNYGEVIVLDSNLASVRTIKNTSVPNARFGAAVACGYFSHEISASGFPSSNIPQDCAIGAPDASVYGPKTGMVIVLSGSSWPTDLSQFTTRNGWILKPEATYSRFGSTLASVKFLSSPDHYGQWGDFGTYFNTDVAYFDNADDLVVGAPDYTRGTFNSGKLYIYQGGTNFDDKAESGYSPRDYTRAGEILIDVGDITGTHASMILTRSGLMSYVDMIMNSNIPDTVPPHVSILPIDHEYEVPTGSAITIDATDSSGISDIELQIRRNIGGSLIDLVSNGKIINSYFTNGKKNFGLQTVRDPNNSRHIQYVLTPSPNTPWLESEVIELEVTVGDNRQLWKRTSGGKLLREYDPLHTRVTHGFVSKFKPNSQGISRPFNGQQKTNTFFGSSLANVGDVNNDGMNDFMVGEYGNDSKGFNSGMSYLFLGDPNIDKFVEPDAKTALGVADQPRPSAKFGSKVAAAGDMNGDGYSDVAVVAPNNGPNGSEIYIMFGNPDPRTEITEFDRIRVDGAPQSYPWDSLYLSRYATCIEAAQQGDGAGYSIMGYGDINGDGYSDVIIGAPFYGANGDANIGRTYVIFGHKDMIGRNSRYGVKDYTSGIANNGPIKLDQMTWDMTTPTTNNNPDTLVGGYIPSPVASGNEQFGSALISNININGDYVVVSYNVNGILVTKNSPLSEVLISARGSHAGAGVVYIYSKTQDASGWKMALKNTVSGEASGDGFGSAMANLGDISADTNLGNNLTQLVGQDFVIGAPGNNGSDPVKNPKYEVGAAYVYVCKPKNINDFSVTLAMKTYGQNAGDQFGYAVANVGNLDNNVYGNNAIGVGAPYYCIKKNDGSRIENAGRLYIFPAGLRNTGTDIAPNYVSSISSYPVFVAQGNETKQYFGAAMDYLGDMDGDFIPEYIVGAPGYSSSSAVGNMGVVELYSNPDTTPPDISDPMTYVKAGLNQPLVGNKGVDLITYQTQYNNGVTVNIPFYNKVNFRVHDDRAVMLDSVIIELDPEGANAKRAYLFVPAVPDKRYYTYYNRKQVDFFLNLEKNVYWETTYNVRIYAKDKKGNSLQYDYPGINTPVGYDYWGNNRVPEIPQTITAITKPYFEFKFRTTVNIAEAPDVKISMLGINGETYLTDAGRMTVTIKDNALLNGANFWVTVSPNGLITVNPAEAVTFYLDTTNNITVASRTRQVTDRVSIDAFANGDKDGVFEVTAIAEDIHGNVNQFTDHFIRDVAAPVVTPLSPQAGTTNNPDDCSINVRVVDRGAGVKLLNADGSYAFTVSLTTQNTIIVPSKNIFVTYNASLAAEGYANNLPDVLMSITGYTFAYKQIVTVSVYVQDNAGHAITSIYSYQVSPDYRPPFVKPGTVLDFVESPFTTGNLSITVNAFDDTGVASVLFSVEELSSEISGNSGLTTDNMAVYGDRELLIPVSDDIYHSQPTKNYEGFMRLFATQAPGEVFKDGLRRVTIKFVDAQGNRSKPVSADITIDAVSLAGGPVMPIIMASLPGATQPPLFNNMPRYINTKNVDVWLFAADLEVRPAVPSGSGVAIVPQVIGYVLGVESLNKPVSQNYIYDNKEIYRLKDFKDVDLTLDPKTNRRFKKVSNLDLSGVGEGPVRLIVNFVDNDAGIQLDSADIKWPISFTPVRSELFNDVLISPLSPTLDTQLLVGEGLMDINSSTHNINNLPPEILTSPNLWNKVHFSDEPFIITVNYDITPPSLNQVIAKAGSTEGGTNQNVEYKASSFSRDSQHIQLLIGYYRDQFANLNITEQYPVTDLYYQIICVSGNDSLLVVDTQGEKKFSYAGKDWFINGSYYAYDGSPLAQSTYISVTANTTPSSNEVSFNAIVTDNLDSTDFYGSNQKNWTHLDLATNGEMNSSLQLEVPVALRSSMLGYYFRVCIRDRAGNYSRIMTTNYVNLDEANPLTPFSYYKQGIKLNRNRFDIDFADLDSGLTFIGYKFNDPAANGGVYQSIGLDGTNAIPEYRVTRSVNGRDVVDYIQMYRRNWTVLADDWNALPEGTATKVYIKMTDAVGSTLRTVDSTAFKFTKDVTPLTVTPTIEDVFKLAGERYTSQNIVTINFAGIAEPHILYVTDIPTWDTLFVPGTTEYRLFKDFSFEDASEAEDYVSHYLCLVSPNDVYSSSRLTLLEQNPSSNGDAIQNKHINGNYALVVSINIPRLNVASPLPYVWPGLATTINVSNNSTETMNYTVGVLVDASLVTFMRDGGGVWPMDTGDDDGGLRLVLENNGRKTVSTSKVNYMKPVSTITDPENPANILNVYKGQDWTLLTANVEVIPNSDMGITINIAHLKNSSTATNPIPFTFDLRNHALSGRILIDALMVVPGRQAPAIFASANAVNEPYRSRFNVRQGSNTFYYVAYDDMSNPLRGTMNVVCDNTVPTWSAATIYIAPPSATPTGAYVAFYQTKTTMMDKANGQDVIVTSSAEGLRFVNSYDKPSNKAYLAAYFNALDPETPIDRYDYEVYQVQTPTQSLKVAGGTKLADNRGVDTPVHSVIIDAGAGDGFSPKPGLSYFFVARAINLLGYESDWVTSDVLTLDVDAPTVSFVVEPGLPLAFNLDKSMDPTIWTALLSAGYINKYGMLRSTYDGITDNVTANLVSRGLSLDLAISANQQMMKACNGLWQDSGWHEGTIHVTLNARDVYWMTDAIAVPGGAGVASFFLSINKGPIVEYPVRNLPSNNVFVTFSMTEEGPNTFEFWATDAFGHASNHVVASQNMRIDRSAPYTGIEFNDGAGVLSSDLSGMSHPIIWSNKPTGFSLKFTDALGVGTRELNWFIDGVAQDPFELNLYPIGQAGKINYVPRGATQSIQIDIKEGLKGGYIPRTLLADRTDIGLLKTKGVLYASGASYYWNQGDVFVNDQELDRLLYLNSIANPLEVVDAWRFYTFDRELKYQTLNAERFTLYNDGYHMISLYTTDKMGFRSPTVSPQANGVPAYVCIDQGKPDVIIDLGGAAQSQWSLSDITISLEAFDVFRDPVLVTSDYYSEDVWANVPLPYQGLSVRRPGSGVSQVLITINNTLSLAVPENPGQYNTDPRRRFGFSVNKGFGLADEDNLNLVITTNGINMMSYRVIDNAGNASLLTYWDGSPEKKFWYDVLNSYVYDGDNGVIRGIKIDTLPPENTFLEIMPSESYTDTLPGAADYPLYTNKRDIKVRFGAKDAGIGVKWAYLTASENVVPSQGIVNREMPDPDNYLGVDQWIDIARIKNAPARASKEQGIVNYVNARWVRLGETQGTRNLMIQYADDFGLEYFVSKASVEQVSATFNLASVVTQNYVPLDVFNAGAYGVRTDSDGSYFVWDGYYAVPAEYQSSFAIKQVAMGTSTINVYTWDERKDPDDRHRASTANADHQIIYDSFVTASVYQPMIKEMQIDTINVNGVATRQQYANKATLTLQYRHDETDELSGITHVMFGAENVNWIKVSGNATTYNANTWVPYTYRSNGVTNNYIIGIKTPANDGLITVNVIGVRDRAGNQLITANMHQLSFYYDRPMPWDNIDRRIVIKDADTGETLYGNRHNRYLTGANKFAIELDMFGAGSYRVDEYLLEQATKNNIASGNYDALADLPGGKKLLPCELSQYNQLDGMKTLYVTLFDIGNGPSSSITVTYNYIIDNTNPTISIRGLEDKNTKFYQHFVTFSIVVSDLNPSASYVSGLDHAECWVNSTKVVSQSYLSMVLNVATFNNLVVNTSGLTNTVVCKVFDKVGNSSIVTINGIRLNANPPVINNGIEAAVPTQGRLVDGVLYVRTSTPNIRITGESLSTVKMDGDLAVSLNVSNYNTTKYYAWNLAGDDGTKNITVEARDYYSDYGGPIATKTFTIFLDRQAPQLTVTQLISSNISYIPDDMMIVGTATDFPDVNGYFSGAKAAMYLNNDLTTQLPITTNADHTWQINVRQLVETSGYPEGTYTLRIFSRDCAGNVSNTSMSDFKIVTFNLSAQYVKGGINTNINNLNIAALTQTDQRVKVANAKVQGMLPVSGLDQTLTEFKAYDATGTQISTIQTSSGNVKLVMQYPAPAGKGVDPDNFRIYYLNETTAEWELVSGNQVVDKTNRTIEVMISHFSIYRVFAPVQYANDLKDVHMYPNPYVGNDDNRYNGEDGEEGYDQVTFENITETTKVRIYTISGELVNTLEPTGGKQLHWALDNMHGQAVASGIYIVLLTDENNNKHIGRLTIVR
jgi:hypothetical protein